MAPFIPLPGFGGQSWRFYPLLSDAVQNCFDDFSINQLMTDFKKLFEEEFENFDLYPTLEDIDELTLLEIKIWPQEEEDTFDPMSLPTQDPTNEEDPFESFIPFVSSGRHLNCYLKFYRTLYVRRKWSKIVSSNGKGDE